MKVGYELECTYRGAKTLFMDHSEFLKCLTNEAITSLDRLISQHCVSRLYISDLQNKLTVEQLEQKVVMNLPIDGITIERTDIHKLVLDPRLFDIMLSVHVEPNVIRQLVFAKKHNVQVKLDCGSNVVFVTDIESFDMTSYNQYHNDYRLEEDGTIEELDL
jgi:hypothetical protein